MISHHYKPLLAIMFIFGMVCLVRSCPLLRSPHLVRTSSWNCKHDSILNDDISPHRNMVYTHAHIMHMCKGKVWKAVHRTKSSDPRCKSNLRASAGKIQGLPFLTVVLWVPIDSGSYGFLWISMGLPWWVNDDPPPSGIPPLGPRTVSPHLPGHRCWSFAVAGAL